MYNLQKVIMSSPNATNPVKMTYVGLSMLTCQMIHTSMRGRINKSLDVFEVATQRSNLPKFVIREAFHDTPAGTKVPVNGQLEELHPSLIRGEHLGQKRDRVRKLRIRARVLNLLLH